MLHPFDARLYGALCMCLISLMPGGMEHCVCASSHLMPGGMEHCVCA